jgi:O-antigen/teichoic acid export membrane protein
MAAQTQAIDVLSTEHLRGDLKRRSFHGGLFTLGAQGALYLVAFVATVVMARLLTPTDYGLVAMVTTISQLGQAFADLGLSEATIQREKINHEEVSALFWINVAIGLGLMLIMAALAPCLAWFYREPRLLKIALVVSTTFLMGGLRVQHDALLKRQMRFIALALRDLGSMIVGVIVALLLVWRGAGYWAIVALSLCSTAGQTLLSWFMVRWLPSPPRRSTNVRSLVDFGSNVAASYLIYNINRSADQVLIGWAWGAGPLGLYSKAYNLLMLPVRQLGQASGKVSVPAFSRLQDEPERFARYYLRLTNLMFWISAPLFAFLFLAAQPVIVIALGKQWSGAVPVFRLLAVSAFAQVLLDPLLWLLVSLGQSGRLLRLLFIISPILIASFAIGLPFGIKGVALSGSLCLVGMFPWVLKFVFHGTHLTLQKLGQAILCPISVCLMAALGGEVALRLTAPQGTIPQLMVAGVALLTIYSLSLLIPPVRHEVLSIREFGRSR